MKPETAAEIRKIMHVGWKTEWQDVDYILKLLEKAETNAFQWIPVQTPPKKSAEYLVWCEMTGIAVAKFLPWKKWAGHNIITDRIEDEPEWRPTDPITHWTYLPKGPEGSEPPWLWTPPKEEDCNQRNQS